MLRLTLALFCGLLPALAQAADCKPSPLGERELFLRGSFNNWSASDEHRFVYVCDRYELYAKLSGEQSFKIGDEDWSSDADFGGSAAELKLKGGALSERFGGGHKLQLRFAENGVASLQISPFSGEPPQLVSAPSVTDTVALSIRFDSRDGRDKSPFGAVTPGKPVRYSFQALPGIEQATLVIAKRRLEGNQELLEYGEATRLPMTASKVGKSDKVQRWSASHSFAAPAIYGYHFEVQIKGKTFVYQNKRDPVYWTREKGSMGLGLVDPLPENPKRIRRYRQTVYAADFQVPAWARDAVFYNIFPERFRNGDADNDPRPGRDHYQDKDVEFHANWLDKPAKPNTQDGSDDTYNNDFFGGDLAGIISRLDYIKSLGANAIYMTPIFRAASNHKYDTADYTQVDPAFGTNADFKRLTVEAAKRGIRVIPDTSLNHVGSDSPYFNRFGNYPAGGAFDDGALNPASGYASWFKLDAAQAKAEDQYQGWAGVKDLPEIDKGSKAFRAFAYGAPGSVMLQWLDLGAAGWRMDVAPWVPDDFWREWRAAIKSHKADAFLIAETWFDASKFLLGDSFDSSMNYIFRNTVLDYAAGGDAGKLYPNIELMREAYPPQAFFAMMNLLSSHDQARALHHLGWQVEGDRDAETLAKQRLRLASFMQMTLPGAPAIYYGDEVGVGGGEDPFNRATYPWADLGGQPDNALLADIRRLTQLRHQHKVLRHGSFSAPLHLDAHVIVLARQDGKTWALSASNNDSKAQTVKLKLAPNLRGLRWKDAFSGRWLKADRQGQLQITVPPMFGRVLISH
ncbi:glycoside hydrolase family 13 protein [Paucibacter sp. B2R-40]|uniref:glycoside hydrolase family 13 protein n=1 Tax=Paucibacter sp. B2R-40 TaxID=2893554 RepID=UPI0021E375CB|nr:glycoside hydrolase family 13 protein [Paucibacter sp. B2R-40]MCV2353810.1 glycoside hydrolase family 13 protein [Paucibacter sp. B2R-40]